MIRTLASVVLAASLGLIVAPAPASAEPAYQQVSVEVTYSDLNPSTLAGARALLGRIQRAAHQACGGSKGFAHLAISMRRAACKRDAVARAAASLDRPMVSALLQRGNPARAFSAR